MKMNLLLLALGLGVLGSMVYLMRAGAMTPDQAREHIRQGGKVIDVRTAEEYQAAHLPGTTNIPLSEIEQRIASMAPDKNTCLLLHCRSGGRSGVARQKLLRLGYTRVYNLGSYSQAEKALRPAKP